MYFESEIDQNSDEDMNELIPLNVKKVIAIAAKIGKSNLCVVEKLEFNAIKSLFRKS